MVNDMIDLDPMRTVKYVFDVERTCSRTIGDAIEPMALLPSQLPL